MANSKIEPTVKRRVSSGNRGAPLSSLFAAAERQYPGIEEEVGLSSAALRAGELVRGMRKANGWTQTTLAEALGWDQVRISNIERGEGTRGPTFDVLTKIAEACGYDLQFTPRAMAEAVPDENKKVAKSGIIDPASLKPMPASDFGEIERSSPGWPKRDRSRRLVTPDDDDFAPPMPRRSPDAADSD